MIVRALLAAALASGAVQAPKVRAWEKPLAPGLTYRMEVEEKPPRTVHILRFNPRNGASRLEPALAGGTVYEPGAIKGRGTTTSLARETEALAVINGDYFPYTGDPLGLMVRAGQLVSLPNPRRSAFAWGPNEATIGRAAFSARAMQDGRRLFSIDGLNEDCPLNRITLNLPEAGLALGKAPGARAVLRFEGGRLPPSSSVSATVLSVAVGDGPLAVAPGQAVLVAQGEAVSSLLALRPDARLTIELETTGFPWERFDAAIGGGPRILRGGEFDPAAEDFGPAHIASRHPRTAVGITASGDWILAVVDGRQKHSVGASLTEMAVILKRQGCVEALNLDGGGSTAMNALGLVVNRPSDKTGERPFANGLVIRGLKPRVVEGALKLVAPKTIALGEEGTAEVRTAKGVPVANVETLWGLQGAAWIDQGGTIHPIEPGIATLSARVRGQTLTTKIEITQTGPPGSRKS